MAGLCQKRWLWLSQSDIEVLRDLANAAYLSRNQEINSRLTIRCHATNLSRQTRIATYLRINTNILSITGGGDPEIMALNSAKVELLRLSLRLALTMGLSEDKSSGGPWGQYLRLLDRANDWLSKDAMNDADNDSSGSIEDHLPALDIEYPEVVDDRRWSPLEVELDIQRTAKINREREYAALKDLNTAHADIGPAVVTTNQNSPSGLSVGPAVVSNDQNSPPGLSVGPAVGTINHNSPAAPADFNTKRVDIGPVLITTSHHSPAEFDTERVDIRPGVSTTSNNSPVGLLAPDLDTERVDIGPGCRTINHNSPAGLPAPDQDTEFVDIGLGFRIPIYNSPAGLTPAPSAERSKVEASAYPSPPPEDVSSSQDPFAQIPSPQISPAQKRLRVISGQDETRVPPAFLFATSFIALRKPPSPPSPPPIPPRSILRPLSRPLPTPPSFRLPSEDFSTTSNTSRGRDNSWSYASTPTTTPFQRPLPQKTKAGGSSEADMRRHQAWSNERRLEEKREKEEKKKQYSSTEAKVNRLKDEGFL